MRYTVSIAFWCFASNSLLSFFFVSSQTCCRRTWRNVQRNERLWMRGNVGDAGECESRMFWQMNREVSTSINNLLLLSFPMLSRLSSIPSLYLHFDFASFTCSSLHTKPKLPSWVVINLRLLNIYWSLPGRATRARFQDLMIMPSQEAFNCSRSTAHHFEEFIIIKCHKISSTFIPSRNPNFQLSRTLKFASVFVPCKIFFSFHVQVSKNRTDHIAIIT